MALLPSADPRYDAIIRLIYQILGDYNFIKPPDNIILLSGEYSINYGYSTVTVHTMDCRINFSPGHMNTTNTITGQQILVWEWHLSENKRVMSELEYVRALRICDQLIAIYRQYLCHVKLVGNALHRYN